MKQLMGVFALVFAFSAWAEDVQVAAVTVDAQGKVFTAITTFSGGLSLDGKNFTATVDATAIQDLYFETNITLDDADVGKTVDILLVVGSDTTPPYDGADAVYNSINIKNRATPVNLYSTPDIWMAQLTDPYKTGILLKKTMTIKLGRRKLPLPGIYYVYAAYRTPDGAITYSPQPAIITITG